MKKLILTIVGVIIFVILGFLLFMPTKKYAGGKIYIL